MQQPKRNSQPYAAPAATNRHSQSQTRSVSAGVPSPSTPAPSTQWASQRPADPARSLFNLCTTIMSKLERIGSLHTYIEACSYTDERNDGMPRINLGVAPYGGRIDPVSQLWRVLRLGAPLCEILGALDPKVNVEVLPPSQCTDIKVVKRLLYRFLQGCLGADLKPHLEDSLFTISNVFSDSTSDLLKVIKTLQIVLHLLVERNILPPSPLPRTLELPQPRTKRDQVVNELIQTERKYVQDLELMGDYMDAMLNANVPRETVQRIFPYLSRLVDFQRRFLVGLEYHARLPPHEQQFGSLFEIMRDEFEVYEGYTLGQREATEAAQQEVSNLIQFSDILEPHYELPNMLLKPVQRIGKYPLLLRELIKSTPKDWTSYSTLENGLEIMQDIMITVNETQRKVECRYAFDELRERVKSWHDISIDRLGELLLSGVYPVVERESETEYHLYLFENILLCCRDNFAGKKSLKMRSRASTGQMKRGSLDLKGRLYLSAVVGTSVQKEANGFLLSITWGRGDAQETGHFDVRLYNEEQCTLWDNAIKRLLQTRSEYVPSTDDVSPFYEDSHTPLASPIDGASFRKLSISSVGTGELRRSSAVSSSATTLASYGRISNPQMPPLQHTYSESTLQTLASAPSTPSEPTARAPAPPPISTAPAPAVAAASGVPAGTAVGPAATAAASTGPATPTTPVAPGGPVTRVRIFYLVDSFVLLVDKGIGYASFLNKVERKIRLCGKVVPNPLRIKYKDEDEDYVVLNSDDDLAMAFECSFQNELNLLIN